MHLFEKRERFGARGLLISVLIFVLLLFLFAVMLSRMQQQGEAQETVLLRDALRNAAITCYAIEGRYPPSVEYMEQYYGIAVDEERFIINYDAFASNVMPYVAVLQKGAGGL